MAELFEIILRCERCHEWLAQRLVAETTIVSIYNLGAHAHVCTDLRHLPADQRATRRMAAVVDDGD